MDPFIQALSQYGPLAFGTVVLVVVWRILVQPTIGTIAADIKVVAKELRESMRTNLQTAEANLETARMLRDVSENLRAAAGACPARREV